METKGVMMISLWMALFSCAVSAALYHVGPLRADTTLQMVADRLNPGDTVLVDGPHTYSGGVVFTRPGLASAPITVMMNPVSANRPTISGGVNTVHFRTDYPYSGPGADHYVFNGFVVTGGSFRGIFLQGDDITLRNVLVRDCPAHGILAADLGTGNITLEHVEVYGCGNGSSQHQIYVTTDQVHYPGSVFRMRYCYLHDANGGNNVKSRAERNEIYYNWIEGAYYHELELIGPDPGGLGDVPEWTPELKREDSDVAGNVLRKRKTAAGNDSNFSVIRAGGDGTGETNGRYRFVNNTIISGTGSVFRIFDGIESIEMHNNVFVSLGNAVNIKRTVEAVWSGGSEVIAGSNNWVKSGAQNIPVQWTGTLSGADPGFADVADDDYVPQNSSVLVDAGAVSTASAEGHDFPAPLFPPAFVPPEKFLPVYGTPVSRPWDGSPDIGAYEYSALDVRGPEGARIKNGLSFPSPFASGQAIAVSLAEKGYAEVRINDVRGRQIALAGGGVFGKGVHLFRWNGENAASGVYYCILLSGGTRLVHRLVLIR